MRPPRRSLVSQGSNILITKSGGIKLSDFGVSALATESEKRLSVVGTPYWSAFIARVCECRLLTRVVPPEVINLNGWANTSDVWSLGCTVIGALNRAACVDALADYIDRNAHGLPPSQWVRSRSHALGG